MSFINQTISKIEPLQGIQVLVVDNDRDSCHLYAVLLNNLGATVTIADSIKEALGVLNWLLPTIVICEMRFYGESIQTLTTKLCAMELDIGNPIPAIAITTWVGDSLAQILETSFEGYLLKPIDLNQLVFLIKKFASANRRNPLPYEVRLTLQLKNRIVLEYFRYNSLDWRSLLCSLAWTRS